MKRPTVDWRILGSEGEIYYLVCWDGFEAVVQEGDGDIDSYLRSARSSHSNLFMLWKNTTYTIVLLDILGGDELGVALCFQLESTFTPTTTLSKNHLWP